MDSLKFNRNNRQGNQSPILQLREMNRNRFIRPILLLIVCLIVTYIIWNISNTNANNELRSYFEFRVRDVNTRIEYRLNSYEQILRSVRGLYKASDSVDRNEFSSFFNSLLLNENYPGIQGVGFSLVIPSEQIKKHIAAVRKEGFPEYKLWPEGNRETYTSIIYLEPFKDRNLRAFGYDMFSEPIRRKAMETARDSNEAAISGKIKLVQETGKKDQIGFLIYLPVYRNETSNITLSERRKNLLGWVYSPFRMGDFMEGLFGERAADLDVEIYDGKIVSDETKMYDSQTPSTEFSPPLKSSGVMSLNGHEWTVVVKSTPELESRIDFNDSLIILIAGLGLSLLLAIITWLIEKKRIQTILANTEHKHAEDRLKESEERFRLLYENAKIGLYRTSPDGTILLANKTLVSMLGYSSFGELAKKNVEQNGFVSPKQRKIFIEKIEQRGEIENFESIWFCQDHKSIFVKESARAIRDSNGNTLYYDGTVEDITKSKQAEEALIESEEKYRALFETSLDGISLLDLNGKIIFANNQVVKLFGYNQLSEFIGLNGFGLIHPEDKPKMDLYFEEFITTGVITNCEVRSVKKDGSEFIGEYSATIIKNADGNPIYMMDVVRDITERKRVEDALRDSEARYRLLFEKSADGILIADVETKTFKYANPALCRMLGYTEKELTRMGLADIHPKHDLQLIIAEFESLTRGDKTLAPDIPCLRKDGSIMFADINSTNITIEGRACSVGLFRDITARKLVDEALKKSELRFKQISENSQESIWEVDSNGLYTYISPVIKEVLGYNAEEITGIKYFYDFFDPENKEERKQGALGVFARKESFRNFINCNIHKDGRKIILSTSGVPILDKENNLIGYRGVDVDITESKQAEKALIESETRARALIDAIPDLIFRLNKEGVYLDYKGAKEDLAFQTESIIGKKNRDIMPPEFADLVDEKIKLTLQTGQIQLFEYQLPLPNRGICEYDARMVPGNPDEVIVIVRDVTERKQAEEALKSSEEQYRSLFENVPVGIGVTDLTGKLITFNDAMLKPGGYSREEIISIGSVANLYYDLADREKVISLMKEKGFVHQFPIKFKRKDGTPYDTLLSLSIIQFKDQRMIQALVEDITERLSAEQASLRAKAIVEKTNKELIKLNAEKDKFFSIIAHDLKSPFNGFLGLTALMADGTEIFSLAEFAENSKALNQAARNLYKLLENLLEWSQIQNGSIIYTPKNIDLSELVLQSIDTINPRAVQKEITIINDAVDVHNVYADEKMISTVIRNLLSNAVKFTKTGGKVIVKSEQSNNDTIEVSVTDNGIGILAKDIERLFKIEEKVSSKGTDGETSTGLGLLLCKEFVEINGGKIWVESKANFGSTFSFTICRANTHET